MPYKILQFEEQPRCCLECGSPIAYGRRDKKFCSMKCKDRWHNFEARSLRDTKARIAGILGRNYEILSSLVKTGKTSIPLIEVEAMGFDTHTVSTVHIGSRSAADFSCYDIAYRQSERKIYDIRRMSVRYQGVSCGNGK